jgi:elongation factor G
MSGISHILKVTGGEIQHGSDLVNQRTGDGVRIGSLYINQGEKSIEVNRVSAGDLAVAVKLKDVLAGDTIATLKVLLKI